MTNEINVKSWVKDTNGNVGQVTGLGEYAASLMVRFQKGYTSVPTDQLTLTVKPVEKGDSITIIGRRWFDKSAGNTYHSCECLVNGQHVATVNFKYGYERAYEYSGMNRLAELGYLPDFTPQTVIWRYCQDRGITYHATHSDVNRKKDL